VALIDDIRQKVSSGQFEFSRHALDQSLLRKISVDDIRRAIENGEVIEDYPQDKYGPSCLIFGLAEERPIHVQVSYPSRPLIKIVTLYQPDPARWTDFRVRKHD
jgi:hypothetical protein